MVLMKEFKIENLLEKHISLKEGIFLETSRIQTDIFSLRAISATNQNHGAGFFVKPDDHDVLNDMLSMSANGANSGFVAYQSLPFAIAQDSYAMELKNNLASGCIAKYIYLYLAAAISKYSLLIYGYQNKAGWERFKESFVSLPIQSLSDAEPDWAYMEEYMKDIEKKTILKVKEENNREIARLNELVGMNVGECLEEVEYAEFRVGDLFEVSGTKSLDAGSLQFVPNGINFIGRTLNNNGIQGGIIEQEFEPNEANSITVSQVGTIIALYQEEPYYTSQNVAKVHRNGVNRLIGLYLASAINKGLQGYVGYNTLTLMDLRNMIIYLPVQSLSDTEPDWNFMQSRIGKLELDMRNKISL